MPQEIEPIIQALLLKLARQEKLTSIECGLLDTWRQADPGNEWLYNEVSAPGYMKQVLEIMEEVSDNEMWAEFGRKLDERPGVPTPATAAGGSAVRMWAASCYRHVKRWLAGY